MANLLIDDHAVTVSLSVVEKVEALHGDLVVPRAAVVRVRVVPHGMEEVHGCPPSLRMSTMATLTMGMPGRE